MFNKKRITLYYLSPERQQRPCFVHIIIIKELSAIRLVSNRCISHAKLVANNMIGLIGNTAADYNNIIVNIKSFINLEFQLFMSCVIWWLLSKIHVMITRRLTMSLSVFNSFSFVNYSLTGNSLIY